MKKMVFILAISVAMLQSLGSCQAKSKSSDEPKGNSVTAERIETGNSAVSGGSEKISKEKFLTEIWDYQNSPEEWKFKGDKPVLIDFYADWCGPCKIASPIIDEISEEYAGTIKVYKIDTDVEKELASVFGIKGIPSFLFIPKEGKPVMTSGIANSKEETKKMFIDTIDKVLLTSN